MSENGVWFKSWAKGMIQVRKPSGLNEEAKPYDHPSVWFECCDSNHEVFDSEHEN